ncbi:MAG: sulfur carrier protein ThiS [Candidatus Margulisiibacteriota bacterium]
MSLVITVNGKATQLPEDHVTLSELLTHLQLDTKHRVIEMNGVIYQSQHFDATVIPSKAVIEIVQFVGGG